MAHACGHLVARSPRLGGDRGGDGLDRGLEDGHESVAGGLDDLAARVGNRGADDAVVLREGGAHRQRVLLPQAGAVLDVGEKECQRRFGQEGRRSAGHLTRGGTRRR